ncbi:ABC transporter substrate-binding protein [Pseudooceanicola algae]|uniref:Thiamine pyrimidine synthase n=1 Tax=Pseudooceanicola algae TaxID=1537215 RepID=A0A418SG33_9RHOB|nr:ABC transporter substrate-binding protein [Pseudooceanicola algae]QPM91535.1 hypothetical protein PSAL_027890 [Pseudooceanicola algae]
MDRRKFLAGTAGLTAGLTATTMMPRLSLAADTTALTAQFGWIANVEYGDHFIALENGFFAEDDLEVEISAGGPNAPNPLTMVSAGTAQIGYASWLPFLDAVSQGNDFVLIAARFQQSPLGIISMAKKPILTAEDIVGSRILLQGASEETAIQATLGLNGISGEFTAVPAGFSPEPLLAGDGDGYTAFATNQVITMETMGLERDKDFFFKTFDELGFPGYAGIAFVERKFLEANRDALVAYTAGLMKAWKVSYDDPAYAARLAVETYGRDYGLDLDQQTRQNTAQIDFVFPGMDADYPLFTLDKAKMSGIMYDAARATGRTDLPDIDSIVDTSIVEDARKML